MSHSTALSMHHMDYITFKQNYHILTSCECEQCWYIINYLL